MKPKSYLIGEVYKNKKGLEFTIIDYVKKPDDKNSYRKIKFIKSGYETVSNTSSIKSGSILDRLDKSVCGVGCIGKHGNKNNPFLNRWKDMIYRCYDGKSNSYINYGAKGVYVCKEWHNFDTFYKDIQSMENFKNMLENPKEWQLDKDFNKSNVYSKDTVKIVSRKDNLIERNNRRGNPSKNLKKKVYQYSLKNELLNTYNSVQECSEKTSIKHQNISSCCRGVTKTAGGYIFRYTKI